MLIRVDPSKPEPLFAQLASAIRGGIARGEVTAGERLPGARDLAESLGLNVHTVLRGYQELRDEGLIELRRGRGAVVTAGAVDGQATLRQAVSDLHAAARRMGLTIDDLVAVVRKGY
jgi:GntR family transcriptional regulator